ncbi:hypothetical protein AB4090_08355 [Acidithiobacillus sp. IBUN Pt1247-S3]|uniref:hypothetical protein n=1 Tax=Acidithiobacillus sp. IBUN Pt1247-S3 TaxID=3166642 RepID=UPI0034E4A2F6
MIGYEDILCQLYDALESVVRSLDASDLYPVIGADDGLFFCELSSGDLMDRKIYTTIWYHQGEYGRASMSRCEQDMEIFLPDPALFIAMLGILQKMTGKNVMILHPLVGGNYLPGWASVMDLDSVKQVNRCEPGERSGGE